MISMVRTAAATAATSLPPTVSLPSTLLLPSIDPAKSGGLSPSSGGSSSAGSSRESYSLCEPLLALRCSLLDVLRQPEARAGALIETVVLCRKAGRVAQGLAALQVREFACATVTKAQQRCVDSVTFLVGPFGIEKDTSLDDSVWCVTLEHTRRLQKRDKMVLFIDSCEQYVTQVHVNCIIRSEVCVDRDKSPG